MHIKDRSLKDRGDSPKGDDEGGPAGLEAVLAGVKQASGGKGYPPVEKWNPPYCGEIGLKIASDGTWFYQGSPIGRIRLVKLFASVLRKDEDGRHYLVTPVEKIAIDVEDAPFLAVEMSVTGSGKTQKLAFRTNLDDTILVGAEHPLRFSLPLGGEGLKQDGLKPYILVRGRLEALVTRAIYYDLVVLAEIEERPEGPKFGVWSDGTFFVMCDARDDMFDE